MQVSLFVSVKIPLVERGNELNSGNSRQSEREEREEETATKS